MISPDLTPEQLSANLLRGNAALMNAMGTVGISVIDAPNQSVTMNFEVRPEFCHSGGKVAQGGFVTAWLDASMAHAVIVHTGGKQTVASLEIKVSFLSVVSPGRVKAVGRIIKSGKRVAFLEASLYAEDDKLLATATSSALLTDFVP